MSQLKTSRVLLPSASRTETTEGSDQTDIAAMAIRCYLDVTDAPGSGGITLVFRGYDRISGNRVELSTGGQPITAIGTYAYEMTPWPSDPPFGNVIDVVSRAVPYTWEVYVKHADSAPYTYSVSAEIVG